ncbi:hypothetical protein MRB53_005346 [Persea americana]|uniref:Uncharacterized protein n=1 Tax=Persea americana TaxID=3435 RepID=A0ACC2MD94_PERAE|nr:hypothetical protein MRB53_005346 [Persea americana]
MYVKYVTEEAATESSKESGGVLNLASLDLESSYCCIWNIADVRKNREQAGRGRPLSRKQRQTKRFLINAMAHARLFRGLLAISKLKPCNLA